MEKKIKLLSELLEVPASDITVSKYDENIFEVDAQDDWQVWQIMLKSDAVNKANDYMKETLWAFNAEFITEFINACDGFSVYENKALIQALQEIQDKLCDSANPILLALIGDNLEDMLEEAIEADGLGHFLSGYDGQLHELSDNYVAWRV